MLIRGWLGLLERVKRAKNRNFNWLERIRNNKIICKIFHKYKEIKQRQFFLFENERRFQLFISNNNFKYDTTFLV